MNGERCPPCMQFKPPMQHNPYEIGKPWRPPGGLCHARQCASSVFCPPLRLKPQTFVNFLKMPLQLRNGRTAAEQSDSWGTVRQQMRW
eukprot:14054-Chlamydomonas_euryale.AAC.2